MEPNNEFDDFFGQPRQGGDGFQYKNHVLSEKEPNVFRIAPPVKSLRTSGRWSIFDKLHYGYTVPNADNPDKPRHRPFRCIFEKSRATGMIEQDCPECSFLESKENEIEAMKAKYVAMGRTPDEAEEAVKPARRLLKDHNLDKKHYVLAKNLAGEWGVLKIPHRAKQALDNLIEKYMKENEGQHPLSPSGGVWFRFTRKGKGLATEHYVEIENESLGGGRFQYKNGALTALDVEGIKKCPDLATLNDNRVLTYDQILALVRSGGDHTITQQVFGQSSTSKTRAARNEQPLPPSTPVNTAGAVAGAPKAPAPLPETPPAAQANADTIAALQAQIAALQKAAQPTQPAPQAPAPQPAPAPAPAPQPAPVPVPVTNFSDMMKLDPAAFLASFPDPNKR